MTWKRIAYLLFMLVFCAAVSAQQTFYHTSEDDPYRRGLVLYQNGKYSAAQQLFDEYSPTQHIHELPLFQHLHRS